MASDPQKKSAKKAGKAAPVPSAGTQATSLMDMPYRSLREEIDRVFESFMQGWPMLKAGDLVGGGFGFPSGLRLSPRADMTEGDDAYEMTLELPGMRQEDVEITVEGGTLTIKGEKRAETERKRKEYHLSERSYGSFLRSIRLPEDVAAEKIAASASDGVLRITMPKNPKAKPAVRKIAVEARK